MTPMQARTEFENAVSAAVENVPMLGEDQPYTPRIDTAWVRAEIEHDDEPVDSPESGNVDQAVVLTATAYTIVGEVTRMDTLAEQIRSAVAGKDLNGLRVGPGRFLTVDTEDDEELANFSALAVSFNANYTQE